MYVIIQILSTAVIQTQATPLQFQGMPIIALVQEVSWQAHIISGQ